MDLLMPDEKEYRMLNENSTKKILYQVSKTRTMLAISRGYGHITYVKDNSFFDTISNTVF